MRGTHMKKSRRLLRGIGITVAAAAMIAVMPAAAALAAPASFGRATSAVPEAGAYTRCPTNNWCIFTNVNGTGPRLASSGSAATLSRTFDNEDVSFANRSAGLVRLYYHADFKGDWVCVNASKYSNYLGPYKFNNGPHKASDGYGESILKEVASVAVAPGKCSNPISLP
jgi:hypothetical protein